MKLGTIIQLPDGRIGTICWRHLDGEGGVWGEHVFTMPEGGFGDLPQPDFMLRKPYTPLWGHKPGCENVGETYTVVREPE